MAVANVKTNALPLDSIRLDGETQPRAEIDEELVAEYSEAMEADAEFPPVVVFHDGVDHWLADGFHRYHAMRKAGVDECEPEIRKGTRRDAILYSVGANAQHGKRRTNADKRKAVITLLNDEEWATWRQADIAAKCGVSREYVSRVKSDLDRSGDLTCDRSQVRYESKHGTTATMDTSNIGKGGAAKEGVVSQDTPKRRAVLEALDVLGDDATNAEVADKAGVSLAWVSDVRLEENRTSSRSDTRMDNAYARVNSYLYGNVEGVRAGIDSMMARRGKLPSQLHYALSRSVDGDIDEWLGVLDKLIQSAKRMQSEIKRKGQTDEG